MFPFFLYEAVISLYPAAADGTAVTGAALWWGAAANRLTLTQENEGVVLAASGDPYETDHQVNEQHTIEVGKTWFLRQEDATDFAARRGQTYVLEIVWAGRQHRVNYWQKRTYYGVTVRSLRLESVGTLHFGQDFSLRAQRYVASGGPGLGAGAVVTPLPPAGGEEQSIGFFHEEVLAPNAYFLGTYRWGTDAVTVSASAIAAASTGTDTVLGLEVNGALTGDQLVLAAGVANTEVSASATFARAIPAGAAVRWKVLSGPADGESMAWQGAVVMQIRV